MTRVRRIMLIILSVLALLAIGAYIFIQQPPFGSAPSGARLDRIKRSPNYRDGAFQNPVPTDVMRQGASYIALLGDYLNKPADNVPPRPLPSVQTNLRALPDTAPTIVWFGHSSYLIKSRGFTVLVDPVLSGSASPVSFFGRSFSGTDVYDVADLPDIDLLVITHDHYDHLDYHTVTQLLSRTKRVFTALGVGAHLERWGFRPDQITEFDWWETHNVAPDVTLTATPARHFSGRGLTRANTLWTSFVLNLHGHSLFLGGDSGYGAHFAEIGKRYGPFDFALLECGQYGRDWPSIHMFPDEVVRAAQDLHAHVVMPVHWGKFSLAYHPWNEPIRLFTAAAAKAGLPVTTPRIGEPVMVGGALLTKKWWAK